MQIPVTGPDAPVFNELYAQALLHFDTCLDICDSIPALYVKDEFRGGGSWDVVTDILNAEIEQHNEMVWRYTDRDFELDHKLEYATPAVLRASSGRPFALVMTCAVEGGSVPVAGRVVDGVMEGVREYEVTRCVNMAGLAYATPHLDLNGDLFYTL